jgi:cobalt-zinc-cadmium resistance protein CzcA
MLGTIIDFHLRHRFFVLAGLLGLIGFGTWTLLQIPIEAFPDLTNNQVVVVTEAPGMPGSEVEQLVTFPIEMALMGMPKTQNIRSISKLGLSMVTVVFDDSVDTYFARQIVNERLQEVRSRLPDGAEPGLGPVATAFGEVYQYTIEGDASAMERKTVHEWQVKNQLRSIAGVNEVNTWGGEAKQYEIEVDPAGLQRYGLTLRDVFERIRENNSNFGGGFIEHASEQYTVRGIGRVSGPDELQQVVLLARAGTPVMLRDIAKVNVRPVPRQGAVLRDGKGETVSGMAIMLKGENGKQVIERVKEKLASIRLPQGMRIVPFYDQSTVIDGTIHTVKKNLFEGGLLVTIVLFLFLRNLRAALIVASVIPLSMLVGFIGMRAFGISANLMSLGAIDFGMIVDGAVVMMENSIRHLHTSEHATSSPLERIRDAAHEVARPIAFGVAIIIAVYMPIVFLEGVEGRMFRPMAITVCSALLGSLILALTIVPTATAVAFTKGVRVHQEAWFDRLQDAYSRLLTWMLVRRRAVVVGAVSVLVIAIGSLFFIGTEFMPKLDEGSILIETRKLPGISLPESIALSQRVEQTITKFPEVSGVVTKLGRPDVATEAMGTNQGDVYVLLRPRNQWRFSTKEQLISALASDLEKIPGISYNFTQPMAMRLDEVVSGVKADVALKIYGEDPRVLEQLALKALRQIATVRGAADLQMEVLSGVPEIRIQAERAQMARYGFNITDLREAVETAVTGRHVSDMIEGQRRFPIVVRLPEKYRQQPHSLRDLMIPAPAGERVMLQEVANVEVGHGPEIITRENGQRRIIVQSNVRGRDLGSFVAEAQQKIAAALALPPGYTIGWGGQFENQQRAMRRLAIVLPLSILIIFGLLFATFDSVNQALLILLNVPFALIGGIAALWMRGLNLNISACIGFIALFGVAVLNGIVLVSSINRLRDSGHSMDEAVVRGAGMRLRPVLMTALVASLGFVPMALSTSIGAEVQRPLATVVIGGLVSATVLTLLLLPLLYGWFRGKEDILEPKPEEHVVPLTI